MSNRIAELIKQGLTVVKGNCGSTVYDFNKADDGADERVKDMLERLEAAPTPELDAADIWSRIKSRPTPAGAEAETDEARTEGRPMVSVNFL
jgi:hypothetical protein